MRFFYQIEMTDDIHEHSFSIVMGSKLDIVKIVISEDPQEEVLIRGELGQIVNVKMVEGVMLEIHGDKGVLRIDLSEGELRAGLVKNKR